MPATAKTASRPKRLSDASRMVFCAFCARIGAPKTPAPQSFSAIFHPKCKKESRETLRESHRFRVAPNPVFDATARVGGLYYARGQRERGTRKMRKTGFVCRPAVFQESQCPVFSHKALSIGRIPPCQRSPLILCFRICRPETLIDPMTDVRKQGCAVQHGRYPVPVAGRKSAQIPRLP